MLSPATAQAYPYESGGPYQTIQKTGGPRNGYEVFRPALLHADGRHHVIVWGNGTGAQPKAYRGLLRHFASWGMIVVASKTKNAGTGRELLAGARWITAQSNDPSSEYYHTTSGRICSSGHSQGAQGSIAAAKNEIISCSVPIEPAWGQGSNETKGPVLLIAGEDDTLVPESSIYTNYKEVTHRAIFASIKGAGHFEPLDAATPQIRHYMTAWFFESMGAPDNHISPFAGEFCRMCEDLYWIKVEKTFD